MILIVQFLYILFLLFFSASTSAQTTTLDPSASTTTSTTTTSASATTNFPFPIPGEPNTTVFDLVGGNRVPPFNYSGYFIDKNAQWSQALRGLCRWTTSDSLCVGTVIPILLITASMLVLLIYNCVITPQKEALMNAAAVRDSPLWPASLQSLTDEEVQEVVTSSSGLALKDLFPLLGLESLVQRAAALGLATLKDLLCANALAVRDIGIEVREQRIMARSLERIATHAKKLVAERQKNKKSKDGEKGVRGRGASLFGNAAKTGLLATAFGGFGRPNNSKDSANAALAAATTNNIVLSDVMNNSASSSADFRSVATTSLFQSPLLLSKMKKFGEGNIDDANMNKNNNNTARFSAASSPTNPPAAFGFALSNNNNTEMKSPAQIGKEKWRKLKGRMAAYSLMEKLASGQHRGGDDEDDDDGDDDHHHQAKTMSPRQQEVTNSNNNNSGKKQTVKKMEFMDI